MGEGEEELGGWDCCNEFCEEEAMSLGNCAFEAT